MPENIYRLSSSLSVQKSGSRVLLSWKDPRNGRRLSAPAGPDELLGLKIVTEGLSPEALSRRRHVPAYKFYRLLSLLDRKGILKAPPALLRRNTRRFAADVPDEQVTATTFGLQWHVTNACDLHCRHCYDRTPRPIMSYQQSLRVLDELATFCRKHWAAGEICFTGGNPFLYPGFLKLYRAAVKKGFSVSILGNPVTEREVEAICRIAKPSFFQVSLEGLRRHNDFMRGEGNFDRVWRFLKILRKHKTPSAVMMTLTDLNMSQVVPLAKALEGKTNLLTFNRLSRVGGGSALRLPEAEKYRLFLKKYVRQAKRSPVMGFKDNLLNLSLRESGQELFGGCTGFGCGAAFSFLAILPDGDVHACRKFPSLLGNIQRRSLEEIYDSPAARRYRRGMKVCDGCEIRQVCGGCLAAAVRPSKPISSLRDPFCWKNLGLQAHQRGLPPSSGSSRGRKTLHRPAGRSPSHLRVPCAPSAGACLPSYLGHPLPKGEGWGSSSLPSPRGEGGERSEPGEGSLL